MVRIFSLVVLVAVAGCAWSFPKRESPPLGSDEHIITSAEQKEFNEQVVECLNETPASKLEGYDEAAQALLRSGLDESRILRSRKQMKAAIKKRAANLRIKRDDSDEDFSDDRVKRAHFGSYGDTSEELKKEVQKRESPHYDTSEETSEEFKRVQKRESPPTDSDEDDMSFEQLIFVHYAFKCIGKVIMQGFEVENSSK